MHDVVCIPGREYNDVRRQLAAVVEDDGILREVRDLAATLQPDFPVDDQLACSNVLVQLLVWFVF